MEGITYKPMGLLWEPRQQFLLGNIFMAKIETEILSKNVSKPTVWKRYIDDVFFLWEISKPDIETSIEQANLHHPTIKFTAEISDTETRHLKEARNSFSLFQTNKHILSLDTVRAIISRRNLARVLSTYRRFLTLCFPPK